MKLGVKKKASLICHCLSKVGGIGKPEKEEIKKVEDKGEETNKQLTVGHRETLLFKSCLKREKNKPIQRFHTCLWEEHLQKILLLIG